MSPKEISQYISKSIFLAPLKFASNVSQTIILTFFLNKFSSKIVCIVLAVILHCVLKPLKTNIITLSSITNY